MSIPEATRRQILGEARGRCFLHRRFWLRPLAGDRSLAKWEALHLHHVVFQSCGGSDAPENLVPLCPSCHAMLHEARRASSSVLPDDELKASWQHWKAFGDLVPRDLHFGSGPVAHTVTLSVNIYGLVVQITVDDSALYPDFRMAVLEAVVDPLWRNDPYFPFLRSATADHWRLSTDDHAPTPWTHTTAISVVTQVSTIELRAPVMVALSRDATHLWTLDEQSRGL